MYVRQAGNTHGHTTFTQPTYVYVLWWFAVLLQAAMARVLSVLLCCACVMLAGETLTFDKCDGALTHLVRCCKACNSTAMGFVQDSGMPASITSSC